ncbi:hypothetical protein [Actinomadura livida]|uniref:Uncharacterized protein n=1 Tax=Actinomadura livida TaxID=79909 RepID=A0A7W7IJA1_9ACTN|nr:MULTISPECIES: hypothetical protein [Actinomadura]MBB4777738.1 hypothetical protein [Actinomadura catellatispora]GGT99085.1 hypothetical protein GCM10010208_23340 [Actinomadura livida]
MTDDQGTGGWRSEELRPARGFQLPWLALAGVLATVVAATTLVIGIGGSLADDRPPDRLLPLQAAAPPPSPSPAATPATPTPESTPSRTPESSAEPRLYEALLRLRFAVDEGVEEGDVRDDVGLDLNNVIENILDRPREALEGGHSDVAYLHHKIATRAREGAIDGDRADELHHILERATG